MSQRTRKRKAAAPVTPPFSALKIAISGSIPGQTQAAVERDFIAPLGGTLAKSISSTTTHLVTTETDYQKPSAKVKSAQAMNIPIVTFQWLEDCLGQNTRLDEASYSLVSQPGAPVSGSTQSSSSRKRIASQASQDSDDDNAPPQPKKWGKASNGKTEEPKSKVVATQDDGEDNAPPPQPKRKGRASKVKPEEPKPKVDASKVDDDDNGAPPQSPKKGKAGKGKSAESEPNVNARRDDDDDGAPAQPTKKGKAGSKGKVEESKPQVEASPKDDDGDAPPQPKKKDKATKAEFEQLQPKNASAQVAKSSDIKIPVDEGVSAQLFNAEVYIDDSGVIYDASLNQTNSSNNNNKFYRIQVLYSPTTKEHCTWTRWGRVGEFGQTKMVSRGSLENALRQFNDKFKSKSGLTWANRGDQPRAGKYAFIEKSYEPDSEDEGDGTEDIKGEVKQEAEPESKLPKSVQELMQLIFNTEYFSNVMTDLNYDSAKLPLGKLSKATISRGFQALKDLSALLDNPTLANAEYGTDFGEATEHLSNLFFTIIPHAFGRNRPPIIQNQAMLKKELELLESLSDMKDAAQLMKIDVKSEVNQLDRQFQGLGLNEMTPLDETSEEFTQLRDYLMNTRGETHNLKYNLQQIFRIEREGEFARFDASHQVPRDRRLLWHGSRCTNYGGILSQGLRIAPPEAPMFGKGIYLADMSSKSANYCHSYISNGHALLLLCEAELGDPIQTFQFGVYDAAESAKEFGMLSTWGQGMTGPSKWKDAECVHPSLKGVKIPDTTVKPGPTNIDGLSLLYNEYICYDISQVRLRYLLRVKLDG